MPLYLAELIASHILAYYCQHSALEASKHVFLAAVLLDQTCSLILSAGSSLHWRRAGSSG